MRTIQVSADVDIDDVLDELDDDELANALKRRGLAKADTTKAILAELERLHCPDNILGALREWLRQPVVTETRLREWREFCGVKQ